MLAKVAKWHFTYGKKKEVEKAWEHDSGCFCYFVDGGRGCFQKYLN
jgi:hypothetical protein